MGLFFGQWNSYHIMLRARPPHTSISLYQLSYSTGAATDIPSHLQLQLLDMLSHVAFLFSSLSRRWLTTHSLHKEINI